MMVIFLTGLVSMILMRTLRNDYAKYAREDDDLETLVRLSWCLSVTIIIIIFKIYVWNIDSVFLESSLWFWLSILVQPPNISRKEMLVKNLAGNLCMVMFFGLLAVWLFFQLLLVQVLSLHCWFFLSSCWLLLGCCMLGKSITLNDWL